MISNLIRMLMMSLNRRTLLRVCYKQLWRNRVQNSNMDNCETEFVLKPTNLMLEICSSPVAEINMDKDLPAIRYSLGPKPPSVRGPRDMNFPLDNSSLNNSTTNSFDSISSIESNESAKEPTSATSLVRRVRFADLEEDGDDDDNEEEQNDKLCELAPTKHFSFAGRTYKMGINEGAQNSDSFKQDADSNKDKPDVGILIPRQSSFSEWTTDENGERSPVVPKRKASLPII